MEIVNFECRICGNKVNNKNYVAKEMYFGTRDEFDYVECDNCGNLQIKEYPENIANYYPDNYGSFSLLNTNRPNKFIGYLREQRLKYAIGEKYTPIGFFINLVTKSGFEQKLLPADITTTSSILDIGSGIGGLLINLRNKGFKDITGIDIFIKDDIVYDKNLKILKKGLDDIEEQYDFIMLNHSFEHMPNQHKVLQQLYRIIKPGKMIMIRIPVKTEYIWKRYGVKWGSLDAPRHFYLHTLKSMDILAQKNNFKIEKVIFDSGIFQFYSSEQYLKNIPLRSENSYYVSHSKSIFNKKDIKKFTVLTRELNKTQQGDCACFYLTANK
jgi:2-polyprenyl-3-methyl-5-hydroxy-6-metoxy-1,4-benzoquinol methylase